MSGSLSSMRVANAKKAFVTRRVPKEHIQTLIESQDPPQAGDLLLARVDQIGHHGRLENAQGRREHLFIGDEIIVAYGNRYAPDQFEAEVPADLGPSHLVAAGGIASQMLSQHERVDEPTSITPLGLLGDKFGRKINLRDYALQEPEISRTVPVIAVVGASMNSGKTTMAACLARGLREAGQIVGSAKVTGTGAGGDVWKMRDAGTRIALDFTDAGYASTYKVSLAELDDICRVLYGNLAAYDCTALVIEVADGLCQQETAQLLQSATFKDLVDGVLFAAGETMSAAGAVTRLQADDHPVLGVGGRMTRAPLAIREAEATLDLPCYTSEMLVQPHVAADIMAKATQRMIDRTPTLFGRSLEAEQASAQLIALKDSVGANKPQEFDNDADGKVVAVAGKVRTTA